MQYYSCKEHIELAIDYIVDEQETAPELEAIEQGLSTMCSFCEERATYIVKG